MIKILRKFCCLKPNDKKKIEDMKNSTIEKWTIAKKSDPVGDVEVGGDINYQKKDAGYISNEVEKPN